MGEVNVYGIYVPILLVQAIFAYVIFRLCARWIQHWIARGWIIVPSIFNLCFYILLLLLTHGVFLWYWA
ncbi:DUF1656 domain-containing protein [Acinetobacter rudis]|uniref:DUF1656 domain-containing protein n=1 Tax=Acinetobacter rudis TaxID=632955 RepID=A0AAW8JAI7_9GAMM|nr:DUF1656 domain-containing protein [Acinetobacter rudis]MDQ8936161.1 DUF1656 domain-containing protein [Acinetobacter rudis]MDQ8954102.1 DUF1656 domain-containing protein [Acinetobacter rudis]MDQ9018481.1 DUF1656 domain-containing protein [Acinetobacter rudis]